MSGESTALHHRLADELVRDRCGGLAGADLLPRSVDVGAVRELQLQSRWEDAGRLLPREAKALHAAGAELVVMCSNYMRAR
jgi:aspartate racemase